MIGLQLLGVLVLVAANAFFSAVEFALVAVRVSRVRQLVERGSSRARVVQELLGQLDLVVSGVQVGITLTSLGLGALGEAALAQILRPMLGLLPGSRATLVAHGAALAIAFAMLTVLHVVLGELVPKTISLERAERVALLIARPFYWFLNTFRWAIVLLDKLSRRVVRALGVTPPSAGHSVPHSTEELQIQIQEARERGILAPSEERFMLGSIKLGQLRVREIMVPRPDMHVLPIEAKIEDALTLFATTQRSRLPVYHGSLDHILGFIHIKDMLWALQDRARRAAEGAPAAPFDAGRLLREVLIVPENKIASDLLVEMRTRRVSLAMVVDEYGSILGLVTLEDLLEQVVGEIHDEFDVVESPQILGSGSDAAMVFDGGIGLRDLDTQYNISLPDDPAYSTLGGFVLAQLGFIPRGGEGFDHGGYRFTVVEMDRRRVARVKLQRLAAPIGEPATSPGAASGRGEHQLQAGHSTAVEASAGAAASAEATAGAAATQTAHADPLQPSIAGGTSPRDRKAGGATGASKAAR
jgi:CBS domain containing-hemolysin-like protein